MTQDEYQKRRADLEAELAEAGDRREWELADGIEMSLAGLETLYLRAVARRLAEALERHLVWAETCDEVEMPERDLSHEALVEYRALKEGT